jgi:hypothetical protein
MSSEEQEVKKVRVIQVYKEVVEQKRGLPTYRDFIVNDISRDTIRSQFGGIEILHTHMKETESEFLSRYFSSVEDIFSEMRGAHQSSKSRFVITTAVADSKADQNFLSALDNYCNRNDAQLVIMPCESITNSFENRTATFDPVFNDPKYLFVREDTPLNTNITLCSIQVSAKQIKPITGLQRLGNREGSYIFASPKQFLEYTPSGNSREKNFTIMTPGACTLPSYYTETFVSKRLSYIANFDHTIGAIIVDVVDDRIFDFRQIQAAEDGSFADMGMSYSPDGSVTKIPVNVVLGDLHGIKVDKEALDYFLDLFSSFDVVENVFVHDLFDGYSISHHIKDIYERAIRSEKQKHSLAEELQYTYDVLNTVDSALSPNKLYVVKSNHDEFLTRYLSEARYASDSSNHYLSLKNSSSAF